MIEQQSAFHRVNLLCQVLGVSPSAYYSWLKKIPSKRCQDDRLLMSSIKTHFMESRQTYGVPRLQQLLRQLGSRHGKERIKRLMKQQGLKPKAARRFKVTTDSQHKRPVAANLLGRQFNPSAANKAWASDITYIRTGEGWLYLATVIDLFNRKIVGWSMGTRLVTQLIEDALTMALRHNNPPSGVIHHSDRGSQYCSDAYQKLLKQYGFICSMSGAGNCYDNAVMESFYHTLKIEAVYGEPFKTRVEAQLSLFDYIEVFYNRKRIHSTLGYQTPTEFGLVA
ncbi:IS3 family transposase [Legionella drozanskii]|uniref:IS3 element protein InsF n=1 Tax=Legionella drozanskii LLAP-1 TaxID=1212489 RepID=A0A0W0T1U1_9GAMM|nr:IS3 family transposase [Legionella drozanskii]KTC89205.1 IS3 element protein InsF [Legionella drozanskii LLAP-1]